MLQAVLKDTQGQGGHEHAMGEHRGGRRTPGHGWGGRGITHLWGSGSSSGRCEGLAQAGDGLRGLGLQRGL